MTSPFLIALGLALATLSARAVEPALPHAKQELIFLIDEGLPGGLLLRSAEDKAARREKVGAILDALRPLTSAYRVSLLVYPTHHYDSNASTPEKRVKAPLRELFEQLAEPANQDFGLWLEAYSSGIQSNQSGEVAALKPAPLHPNDAMGRTGWAMDVETIAALKKAYPSTFRGIRFHEILGSHAAWIHSDHARRFSPEESVIHASIELCKHTGLELLWGESVWLQSVSRRVNSLEFDPGDPPFYLAKPFSDWIARASDQLGPNLTFNTANNNFHPGPSLGYWTAQVTSSPNGKARPIRKWMRYQQTLPRFPLTDRGASHWGVSVQSWLWPELINSLVGCYFPNAESNAPSSSIIAQSIDALERGAKIIQFEPSWYFFREAASGADRRSFDDRSPDDHRARVTLQDLIAALLYQEPAPAMKDLYDADLQRLCENDQQAPPKLPWSFTAVMVPTQGRPTAATAGPGVSRRLLFDHAWWNDSFDQLGRIDLDGDGTDEFFGVRPVDEGAEVVFFNVVGGVIDRLKVPEPKAHWGRIQSANLHAKVIGAGDPDELVFGLHLQESTSAPRIYGITRKWKDSISVGLERVTCELPPRRGATRCVLARQNSSRSPDGTRKLGRWLPFPGDIPKAWALGDYSGDGSDEVISIQEVKDGGLHLTIRTLDAPSRILFEQSVPSATVHVFALSRRIPTNSPSSAQ
jgi:hypothetical protein